MAALACALLACGPPGESRTVVERHAFVGRTPPPGPRALGPALRRGEGSFQTGAVTVRAKQHERSSGRGGPANVTSMSLFHLRYAHGITQRFELGGGVVLAPPQPSRAASRNLDTQHLPRDPIFGADVHTRFLWADAGVIYFGWLGQLSALSLPFDHHLSYGVDGSLVSDTHGPGDLLYVTLQLGPYWGVRVTPDLTAGSGFTVQNYPLFQDTLQVCINWCKEEPDATKDVLLVLPFLWLSYAPRPFTLTAHAHASYAEDPYLEHTIPYGAGLTFGWIIDWSRMAPGSTGPWTPPPRGWP